MALPLVALGREERLFVVPETTYGAAASAPAGGNATRFTSMQVNQSEERIVRADKKNSRSSLKTVARRKSVDWSITGYLMPSGAAGTAPDGCDDIFEAAFGTETINASTSVVYTLAKEFEKSLTLHKAVGNALASGILAEMVRGAVVNQLTFNLSGSEEAMVTASGFGADVLRAGKSLSTTTGTSTTLGVTAGDGPKFDAGMYINVDADADLLISAVSGDNLTIPSTALVTGDVIAPSACVKSQTFVSTADALSGVLGSCTLAGSALSIISAQINLSNGIVMHNDRFGTDKANSFHQGNRSVTGSITIRLNETNFLTLAKAKQNTNASVVALTLVSGTAAGLIATFSMPTILLDYTALPSTPDQELIVTLPFVAYGASGEDELSLTLT